MSEMADTYVIYIPYIFRSSEDAEQPSRPSSCTRKHASTRRVKPCSRCHRSALEVYHGLAHKRHLTSCEPPDPHKILAAILHHKEYDVNKHSPVHDRTVVSIVSYL